MQLHTAPRSRAAALGRPAPRLLCVRPRTCCRPLAARPRPSPAAAAAAAGKAAQGDGIEFGKPQAPKELYEAIAADARKPREGRGALAAQQAAGVQARHVRIAARAQAPPCWRSCARVRRAWTRWWRRCSWCAGGAARATWGSGASAAASTSRAIACVRAGQRGRRHQDPHAHPAARRLLQRAPGRPGCGARQRGACVLPAAPAHALRPRVMVPPPFPAPPQECGHAMPQGAGPEQQLAHVMGFLYSTWGCKLAAVRARPARGECLRA